MTQKREDLIEDKKRKLCEISRNSRRWTERTAKIFEKHVGYKWDDGKREENWNVTTINGKSEQIVKKYQGTTNPTLMRSFCQENPD